VVEHKTGTYKNSRISYLIFGKGPKKMVCFHGYGEEAGSFAFLDKLTVNQYTFYAIDLPYHGQTVWNEGLLFTPADLLAIVQQILLENKPTGAESVSPSLSLMGFSLGGRAALSLFQCIPQQVEKLVLLAPDGLKLNRWYWLATQTWPGNKFFSFTMKHPRWFFDLLKMLNKLKLVNASIFKFVNFYIGDKEVRQQLYTRWTALRQLKPAIKKIKKSIVEHQTPVRLLYGKHDRIILSSVGEKFRKGIEPYCTLTIIHSGHQVLHEKHGAEIMQAIVNKNL
jgi:pimeloyl-ACP methyl ester carboxylesterase